MSRRVVSSITRARGSIKHFYTQIRNSRQDILDYDDVSFKGAKKLKRRDKKGERFCEREKTFIVGCKCAEYLPVTVFKLKNYYLRIIKIIKLSKYIYN